MTDGVLQNPHRRWNGDITFSNGMTNATDDSFDLLIAMVRRSWRLIAATLSLGIILAIAYLVLASETFSATATLVADRNSDFTSPVRQPGFADAASDSANIETYINDLRSDKTVSDAVRSLNLFNPADFRRESRIGYRRRLREIFKGPSPSIGSEESLNFQLIVDKIQRNLIVRRVGLSYTIEIRFAADNPQRAAEIANELAATLIRNDLSHRKSLLQASVNTLRQQVDQLRARFQSAQAEAISYRTQNGIVGGATGEPITEQQIAQISGQISLVRVQTSEAKAKLDRFKEITSNFAFGAPISDPALNTALIDDLRGQYLSLTRREAEAIREYGDSHPLVKRVQDELSEVQLSITGEIARITEVYTNSYVVLNEHQQSLERLIENLITRNAEIIARRAVLRDLEGTAQTFRTLYDNTLSRLVAASQESESPASGVRLVALADPPSSPTSPKSWLILAIGGGLGLGSGCMAGLIRNRMSRGFESANQLEELCGMRCIATVAKIPRRHRLSLNHVSKDREILNVEPKFFAASKRNAHSFSFAEAFRALKLAVSREQGPGRVTGFVSALNGEGTSTIASNFAHFLAESGRKTLLIDCNPRTPTLSHKLAPGAQVLWLDLLQGRSQLEDVVWTHMGSGLKFLPSPSQISSNEVLGTSEMSKFISNSKICFDDIVLDLPSMLAAVDAEAVALDVDAFVLVVRKHNTPIEAVSDALRALPAAAKKISGCVLNDGDGKNWERPNHSLRFR